MRHWRLIGGLVILLLSGAGVAHAQMTLKPKPDYRAAVWLRVGFTSEGRVLFGASGDLVPGTVGIEMSPGSRLGLVRIFAGLKDSVPLVPVLGSCTANMGFAFRRARRARARSSS